MGEMLDYMEAQRLLVKYGIPVAESRYVKSAEEAAKFSGGKPIVMKVISQKAIHKSRGGLVALGLSTDSSIEKAFRDLSKKGSAIKPYRIIVQKMVPGGIEIIIGGKTDPQFGKLVLLGLGGIYVETFRDFALRLCPISDFDAKSMVAQLRSRKIVAPDEKSEKKLAKLLINASRLFEETKISELDLNPLIFHNGTYEAVDIRMIK
jgi:succinyl-CoA synthetase beta subunit